jgi:hypothetical protein
MEMPTMPAAPADGRPQFAGLQQASGTGAQMTAATKAAEQVAKDTNTKFDSWLNNFHQYQSNFQKQQGQWRDYRQALRTHTTGLTAKFLPELPPMQSEALIPGNMAAVMPPPQNPQQRSSYLEKGSSKKRMKHSTSMRSQLVQQQSALQNMAQQLMVREQADFNHEKADAAHEAQLQQREARLKAEEQRVAQLQTTLVSEQKRVWKQVKAMQAKGAFLDNNKQGAQMTGQQTPKEALLQRGAQVNFQTRQAAQSTTTTAATTTTTSTPVQHPLRMRPREAAAMVQTGANTASASAAWHHGSDLHIVQAAQLPAASTDDEDASGAEAGSDDEDSASKASGDAASEDSAATGAEDAKGEFADNDDLEQILLQQSTKVRRSSDAVEVSAPSR